MSSEKPHIEVVDFEGNWVQIAVNEVVVYEGPRDLYAVLGQLDSELDLDIEWKEGGEAPDINTSMTEAAAEMEIEMEAHLDKPSESPCGGCQDSCNGCAGGCDKNGPHVHLIFDMGTTALDDDDEDYPDDD